MATSHSLNLSLSVASCVRTRSYFFALARSAILLTKVRSFTITAMRSFRTCPSAGSTVFNARKRVPNPAITHAMSFRYR